MFDLLNFLNTIFLNFGFVSILANYYLVFQFFFRDGFLENVMSIDFPFKTKRGFAIVVLMVSVFAFPQLLGGFLVGFDVYGSHWVLTPIERFFIMLHHTHLLSMATYAVLLGYLWNKWSSFYGGLVVTFFAIGVAEFGTIPILYICWGNVFPWFWTWYIPFFFDLMPFLVARKYFRLPRKFYVLLLFSFAVEFLALLPWVKFDTLMWDWGTHSFRPNPATFGKPLQLGNWLLEIIGRVRRTCNVIPFFFVEKVK